MRFENGNLEFRKNGKKIVAPFSFKSGDAFIYDNHQAFKLIDGERFPLTDLEKQLIDIFVNNYKIEETLTDVKYQKKQLAKKLRDMNLSLPVNYKLLIDEVETYLLIGLDITTQSSISNTINFLNLQSPDTTVEWKAKNGFFKVNINQLKEIELYIGNRIQEAFKQESDFNKQIDSIENIEELNNLIIDNPKPMILIPGLTIES